MVSFSRVLSNVSRAVDGVGRCTRRAAGLMAMVVLAGAAGAQPTSYDVIDLGTLPTPVPGAASAGRALSESFTGTGIPLVVGWSSAASSSTLGTTTLPFIWSLGGGMRDASLGLARSGVATDINGGGNHVGYYVPKVAVAPAPPTRGFFVGAITGTFQSLGTLGGPNSFAFGVNNNSWIVGSAQRLDGLLHATLWAGPGNTPVDLGTLGGRTSEAYAINTIGFATGYSQNAAGVSRAFLYNPLSLGPIALRDLGSLVPNGYSIGRDINDSQKIVGQSQFIGPTAANLRAARAVLWDFSSASLAPRNLGVLKNTDQASDALGINNLGEVVGWSGSFLSSSISIPRQRAFIWRNNVMTDLNTLIPSTSGWELNVASEINDAGYITGWGMRVLSTAGRQPRAFLLVPRP